LSRSDIIGTRASIRAGSLELFQAYIALMDNPTEFAFFFAPLGSIGSFGKRIPPNRNGVSPAS
jgi:hypothetical protein